jgi:uncharacterized protein YaiI (UPF0178 family)
MTVWVDADSCPSRVREIVTRAAARRGVAAIFVANRRIPLPKNKKVSSVVVPAGADSADAHISERAEPGDLVITRDIPLAAELVEKNVRVINDRGDVFTAENIRERLSVRNFMKDLRDSGLFESSSGGFGPREIRLFSDAFDRELTKMLKNSGRTA